LSLAQKKSGGNMLDDRLQRVRLRAYLVWEREGRPEGRELEHWFIAEREVADEEDAAGLRAGRDYDEGLKRFEKTADVEKAANAAREALNGPERDTLEKAQEKARRAGKGEDAGGKR
jgi:hypothetical protein